MFLGQEMHYYIVYIASYWLKKLQLRAITTHFVAKIVNTRLTKVFMAIFALAERLPTAATALLWYTCAKPDRSQQHLPQQSATSHLWFTRTSAHPPSLLFCDSAAGCCWCSCPPPQLLWYSSETLPLMLLPHELWVSTITLVMHQQCKLYLSWVLRCTIYCFNFYGYFLPLALLQQVLMLDCKQWHFSLFPGMMQHLPLLLLLLLHFLPHLY